MTGVTNFRNTSFHCSLYFSLFPTAYSCKSGLPNCSNWILSLFFCHLYVKFIYLLDILNIFYLQNLYYAFSLLLNKTNVMQQLLEEQVLPLLGE